MSSCFTSEIYLIKRKKDCKNILSKLINNEIDSEESELLNNQSFKAEFKHSQSLNDIHEGFEKEKSEIIDKSKLELKKIKAV